MARKEINPRFVIRQNRRTSTNTIVFFFSGLCFFILSAGSNTLLAANYSQEYCTSCHIEEENNNQENDTQKNNIQENLKYENKLSIHHARRGDVPADCIDCHTLNPLTHKIVREIQAGHERLQSLMGSINHVEQLEEKRLRLAKEVWKTMKSHDSSACRSCHTEAAMNPDSQKPEARIPHLDAFKSGETCIDCHKGVAHQIGRDQFTETEKSTSTSK